MKTCDDFPDAPGCCDSCHEDHAMGYDMIELYEDADDHNRLTGIVCCAVSRHISYFMDNGPNPSEEST